MVGGTLFKNNYKILRKTSLNKVTLRKYNNLLKTDGIIVK